MLRTFNCGIGMIAVVAQDRLSEVEEALRSAGETPVRMGEVVTHASGEPQVAYAGHLAL